MLPNAVSVRPSVPLPRSRILSKLINESSNFFQHRVDNNFHTKRRGNIPTGTTLTGASDAGRVGTNRDSRRIAGYRSMTAAVRIATATVHGAVYCTHRHASVNLCLSQPSWTTTTKRRQQNRIYLYAEVDLKLK